MSPTVAPLTCDDPKIFAIPLVDGGALDAILDRAAQATTQPGDYQRAQAITRGISFLGAKFDMVLAFDDNLSSLFTPGNVGTVMHVTFGCAIMRLAVKKVGPLQDRTPIELPNPLSFDETESGDILLRWHHRLPFVLGAPPPDGPVSQLYQVDTTGNLAIVECFSGEQQCFAHYGSGSSTGIHRRVKSRRFLDEEHGLFLVIAVVVPIPIDDSFAFGLDVLGSMALRSR